MTWRWWVAALLPWELGDGLWAGFTNSPNIGGVLVATAAVSVLYLSDY
jgi:hypothetical protein